MRNPFAKKTAAERRADTAKRLEGAERAAEQAQQERLRLALCGEDTGPAEEQSWKLEARTHTLRQAVEALDREIAAEAAAKAAAEKKALRDKAIEKVRPWLAKAKSLYTDFDPLVESTKQLADINDSQHGYAAYILGHERKSSLHMPLVALQMVSETFSSILDRLEHDDDLAERINKYEATKELH